MTTIRPRAILAAVALAFLSVSAEALTGTAQAAPPRRRDTTPPAVSIAAPGAGATVAAVVTVSATATDDVGVVGVQFRLDGENLGPEVTVAPYTLAWDTVPAADGPHALTAIARDAAGNATTSEAVAITVDNPPRLRRGVFSSTGAETAVEPAVLANPLVEGVTIRSRWQTVEATEGVHDWSYLDAEVSRVAGAGKQILLRIASGGRNTPAWVMTPEVQTFSFLDDNPYSPTYNTTVTIPVFWDPAFLERKRRFIAAVGQRFGAIPGFVLVSASCANALTDDWNVPHSPDEVQAWFAVGYSSDKLIDACAQVIDATMAAFPDQLVLMAIGRNGNQLDPDTDFVARHVIGYGRSVYPGRFFVQKNSLSARTPDPATTTSLEGWQPLYDSRPEVGGQMLWYVTNDPTCRMNGQVAPCDPATMLSQAVQTGANYGMQYEEIYERDVVNPDLATVIRDAADVLSPPTAPAGLTATATSSTQIRLTWTAATDSVGVTGYRIRRDGVEIASTATIAYQDTGLTPAATYTYEVSALDGAGNESPRASVTATARKK
jgi:chitodextrinase